MQLFQPPYKAIVLDTETTGFPAPEPLEIGILYLGELTQYKDHQEEMESILTRHPVSNTRYCPTKPIDPHAEKVHKISFEHVKYFPKYNAEEFLAAHPLDSVEYIIGHTIDFDLKTLKCVPGLSTDSHFKWKPIDVCKIAKRCWPEFKEGRGGYKLVQIVEKLCPELKSLVESRAHGALADVYFTYLVLAGIIYQYEPDSWEDVYLLQIG